MILELIERECAKYTLRGSRIVYAHMLERRITHATEQVRPNGYMLIGELIHLGLERLLTPGMQLCETYAVWPRNLTEEARRLTLEGRDGSRIVVLCGTPDAFVDGRPLELKTTRDRSLLRHPRVEWMLRATIYATLARVDYSFLVILDINRPAEAVWQCRPWDLRGIKRILADWLSGKDIVSEWRREITSKCSLADYKG